MGETSFTGMAEESSTQNPQQQVAAMSRPSDGSSPLTRRQRKKLLLEGLPTCRRLTWAVIHGGVAEFWDTTPSSR